MTAPNFPALKLGKPELVEVSPGHFTLNKHHPLFLSLCDKTTFFTIPSTSEKVPRLYDVSTITENPALFKQIISWLANRYRFMGTDGPTHILGVETRGCFVAAPLAMELGIPFVPLRHDNLTENSFVNEGESDKPPNPPLSYRHNAITKDSQVVIIDDFISTGRTMDAALDCVEIVGAKVVECFAVCDMEEGGGINYIRGEHPGKTIQFLSLFRLRNSLEVLFVPKKYRSRI